MAALKILIADDEQSSRELVMHYLAQSLLQYTVYQAADGKTTLELLEKEQPDILFLDIKMPALNGIEVLQQREPGPLPVIIFTTAFDEFALDAFDYEATDYLLKPFEKERFDKSLEKATRYIHFIKDTGQHSWLEQVNIKKGNRTVLVPVTGIRYFQSKGAYVEINTGEKSWLSDMSLYELEARLDPAQFVRIHRSLIIQTAFVTQINSLPNGDFIVILKCGKELRGSRTYKPRIKALFPV